MTVFIMIICSLLILMSVSDCGVCTQEHIDFNNKDTPRYEIVNTNLMKNTVMLLNITKKKDPLP